MHPAYSVIFFTVASGAGYGLLGLLGLAAPLGLLPADRWFGLTGLALALLLVTAGLLSSTFHLGHPERAWRAVTQWRSSWLSREGVAALATYLPAGLFALGWLTTGSPGGVWLLAGLLAAVGAVVTVYCTAMIYRSLAAVPQWQQPLVLPVYLLLALYTGSLWLNALLVPFGAAPAWPGWLGLVAALVAWGVKLAYWRGTDRLQPASTAESATGLGGLGPVRLLDPPHATENYLLSEMGYRVARKHAERLRWIAQALSFVLPAALVVLQLAVGGVIGAGCAVLALLSAAAGVLVERWLFFAEARHKVMLYYGDRAA